MCACVWLSMSKRDNSDSVFVCVSLCVCLSPSGGDISTKNLWLAESVLDILLEQKYV